MEENRGIRNEEEIEEYGREERWRDRGTEEGGWIEE